MLLKKNSQTHIKLHHIFFTILLSLFGGENYRFAVSCNKNKYQDLSWS